jgi:NAD(P)-dependent dehydrogenase (short-subunit alcohol dehydrogenase family)
MSAAAEFGGLVVVVTGGASGIGLTTAKAFAGRGASVAVLDLHPEDVPEPLVAFAADVADRASVDTAIAQVVERFGAIDIVVNNAGIGAIGTVEDNDDDEWARVLNINVTGMVRVAAAALPWLRKSKSPAIVNVCSVAAHNGLQQRALYSASKGAVLALTQAMAADHVSEGIRVNCVNPGTAATPWVDRMLANFPDPEAERAALNARQATGRLVSPEEVAGGILYLASPLSASTTGTSLVIDGGLSSLRVRPIQSVKS